MNEFERHIQVMIEVIVIILILATLYATRIVVMPLVMALFIVILAWPLQDRLEKKLPRGVSLVITLTVILFIFGLFFGALVLCVDMIAAKAPEYQQRFVSLFQHAMEWAQQKGLAVHLKHINPNQWIGRAVNALGGFVWGVFESLGLFVLTIIFVVLGLLETDTFRQKLEKRLDTPGVACVFHALHDVATGLRRYILARTFISGLTGLLSGLYTWAIGLDFAFVWGFSAFVLNYIPNIGSVIAVIPPTLLALIMPGGAWLAFITLAGLTIIQFTLGYYLEPWLVGRFLSLSPLALFFSIVFWGLIWGIPGAVLGVPIIISIVAASVHFGTTHWVADFFMHKNSKP